MTAKSTCKLNAFMHFMRALLLIKLVRRSQARFEHTISAYNRRTNSFLALWRTKNSC